jgi:hypothetical protein
MTNNQTLLALYKNPLFAGAVPTEAPSATAQHGRIMGYLRRTGVNDESVLELATVESMPHVPPRAYIELSPVASLPHVPPRADREFSPVVSLPHVPPRA